MSGDGHEQRPSPRQRHECAQSLGLNPLRVCMSEQLTLSACVCKSAAAKITSDYDRAQAWHSCADQQPASVKKTRDRLRSAGYHSAVHVMAAEERPQMYDAFMSSMKLMAPASREAHGMRCGVAAPVVAAASSTRHQLHAASVPAPSPCLCSMVPFAQHALAAIELCGRRSGACKQWRRRGGKADDGSEQICRGRSDAAFGDD